MVKNCYLSCKIMSGLFHMARIVEWKYHYSILLHLISIGTFNWYFWYHSVISNHIYSVIKSFRIILLPIPMADDIVSLCFWFWDTWIGSQGFLNPFWPISNLVPLTFSYFHFYSFCILLLYISFDDSLYI